MPGVVAKQSTPHAHRTRPCQRGRINPLQPCSRATGQSVEFEPGQGRAAGLCERDHESLPPSSADTRRPVCTGGFARKFGVV
jgi:hypothetical protein